MRFAIGGIIQESNDFVPDCCSLDMFRADYLFYGDPVLDGLRETRTEVAGILAACKEFGVTPVPPLAAHSCAYGPLTAECYGHLRSETLRRLEAALPVDAVVFAIHGAMLAEGQRDPEADLLGAMRAQIGGRPVGATLDLHAHVTPRMIEGTTLLVGYSTYPHEDDFEAGHRACRLIAATVRGEVRPAMAMAKAPMIVPATNPMNYQLVYRGIMKAAFTLDTPGPATANLRSLSFRHLRRPYFPADDDIPGLEI